jgi:ABC-type branched-subunit amino acid transport system ATPase component/sugar phosphate permease
MSGPTDLVEDTSLATEALTPQPDEPSMLRHPVRYLRYAVGDEAAMPLAVLFGLNAVDELDRSAFAVLVPEIRDAFGLDNQGILTVVAIVSALGLGLQPFIGFLADRRSRVGIAVAGAGAWGFFSMMTGFAPAVGLLVAARCGSAIGRLVNGPTHDSLLSDYYPSENRPAVFGIHRLANSFGQFAAPLAAGLLATLFTWRAPFIVLSIPTIVLVVVAVTTLREPSRGRFERREAGADAEQELIEDAPVSFSEGFRICWEVRTVRRLYCSLPFLAIAVIGLLNLSSIYYEDVFDVNEAGRGLISAVAEPFQLVGILIFIPLSSRLVRRDPALLVRLVAVTGTIGSGFLVAFALAPTLPLAVIANVAATSVLGAITPGIASVLSLTLPPRARALGFSFLGLFALPGVFVLSIIGGVADDSGIRAGLMVLVPVFLFGCYLFAAGGGFVNGDIAKVRASAKARAEVAQAKAQGRQKLLVVRDLDVAYGPVQVLFGVDFEVEAGEVIALLGTNGAGKSTLLRAISGLQPARSGAVIFDGDDITFAPPQEVAAKGVIQVPGGKGVFPGLSVEENLRIAGWMYQKDPAYVDAAIERVVELFPVLRERWDQPAGLLSGGEQQMVTLAQAFITKPRLLMIDELSLGLAPVIVEQLLEIVQAIKEQGTTLILVEQSVNVALTVAETAYFMEKGEIRFRGPTRELLERPDVLRSVFLEGASGGMAGAGAPSTKGAATNGTASNGTAPARDRNGRLRAPLRATPPPGPDLDLREPADAVLEVDGLVKDFGGIRATNDVSFRLAPGEILGFIGPNGAGKTTLFDQISGYLIPDGGRVVLSGIDVTNAGPDSRARLGLGRSFQDARLFPSMTVTDTIKLALERRLPLRDPLAAALHLSQVKETERALGAAVDDLVELMGLQAFADKFVGELSTGSRRIVDLACVVAHEPDVILFDEPSSGIAQRETEALGPLLRRIRATTGASLLVIEHDMPLINGISDRLIALDLGTVIASGPPAQVIAHPQVVSAYLGTNEAAISRSGGN